LAPYTCPTRLALPSPTLFVQQQNCCDLLFPHLAFRFAPDQETGASSRFRDQGHPPLQETRLTLTGAPPPTNCSEVASVLAPRTACLRPPLLFCARQVLPHSATSCSHHGFQETHSELRFQRTPYRWTRRPLSALAPLRLPWLLLFGPIPPQLGGSWFGFWHTYPAGRPHLPSCIVGRIRHCN
jgi:hypothetical protein